MDVERELEHAEGMAEHGFIFVVTVFNWKAQEE